MRHVVLALNLAHLRRRHIRNDRAITDRILAAELAGIEQLRGLLLKREPGLRLVAVVLPEHHFLFAL